MNERAQTGRRPAEPNWPRRILVGVVLLAALVVLMLVGAAVLPRWWAQRIGDQVQGSITAGTLVGLFYGFVFTLVPLVVLRLAFRVLASWKWRGAAFVVSLILAAPNLLTLGIVLGTGGGAHAGDRILDVEAPAFRGATLAGALLAAGVAVAGWYLLASRRRAWRRADRLAEESRAPTEEGPEEPSQ